MNIDITGLKFNLTPTVKEHVKEKLLHLERFYDDKITEARVVLEIDDGHHRHGKVNGCQIIMRIPGQKDVFVKEWSDDMHKSINQAANESERELKKLKDKLTEIKEAEIREMKEKGFE